MLSNLQKKGIFTNTLTLLILTAILFSLCTCASFYQNKSGDDSLTSFVFGRIQYEEEKFELSRIIFMRIQKGKIPPKIIVSNVKCLKDGTFFIEDLPPGEYELGRIDFLNKKILFQSSNEITIFPKNQFVTIKPNSVLFLGDIKINQIAEPNFSFFGQSDIQNKTTQNSSKDLVYIFYELLKNNKWKIYFNKIIKS